MRHFATLVVSFLLSGWCCAGVQAAIRTLDKVDLLVLAFAKANGAEAILANMIAQPGRFDALSREVSAIPGARIVYSDKPAGYVGIVASPVYIKEMMALPSVMALSVENLRSNGAETVAGWIRNDIPPPVVGEEEAASFPSKPAAQLPKFPFDSDDNVLKDLNAAHWQHEHPTFDGRGVTIGFIEGLPDVSAPEFDRAYTLQGVPMRKVLDSVPTRTRLFSLDGRQDIDDYRWSPFLTALAASRNALEGVLRLPKSYLVLDGLKICRPQELAQLDFSHIRWKGKVEHAYGYHFRWNATTRRVQVDTNCDGSFENERAVGLFRETGELVQLGDTTSDNELKHSLSIAVSQDEGFDGLVFQTAVSDHVMGTAGAAVANKDPAGKINGVAPGAAIVFYEHQGTFGAFASALLKAFSDKRADVLLIEADARVNKMRDIVDGRSAFAELLRRLITLHPKPVFITANNDQGMGQIVDFCVNDLVICVGTYGSRRTTLVNQGVDMGVEDNLGEVGSSGPAADGSIKPDLLAPANPITLALRFSDGPNDSARPYGLYAPKIGYAITGGTSTAAPVAAGAAALLLSAARQTNLNVSSQQLTRAILSSARYLKNIEAYDQGRGVINVEAAFQVLKEQAGVDPIRIDVDAPVRSVSSAGLATPHRGRGLFEREGWSVGEHSTRTIRLTRRSGPAGKTPVDILWEGKGAGTFRSAKSLLLPLGITVALRVDVHPETTGVHSALIKLASPGSGISLAEIGATIVVPETFTSQNEFTIRSSMTIGSLGRRSVFFRVPPGTANLHVSTQQNGDTVQGIFRSPSARFSGSIFHTITKRNASWSVHFPESGVWEYLMTERPNLEYEQLGNPVAPSFPINSQIAIRSFQIDSLGTAGQLLVQNRGSTVNGYLADSGLATRVHRALVAQPEPQAQAIEITEGVEALSVAIESQSDDADLLLFRCREPKNCQLIQSSMVYEGTDRIFVDRPDPGTYIAIIVAQSDAEVRYSSMTINKRLGVVSTDDVRALRGSGAHWEPRICTWNHDISTGRAADLYVPQILSIQEPASLSPSERLLVGAFPLARTASGCAH